MRLKNTCQQANQRCFSAAIGAGNYQQFARTQFEAYGLENRLEIALKNKIGNCQHAIRGPGLVMDRNATVSGGASPCCTWLVSYSG
jgi:hypothetical protein